jgi:hypothetical protein
LSNFASCESVSTAKTCLAAFANGMVSAPNPAPTSITVSSDVIFERLTIMSAAEGSTRKCCPNFFLGLKFHAFSNTLGDVISCLLIIIFMLVYGKIIFTTKGTKITKKLKNISSKVVLCVLRDLRG